MSPVKSVLSKVIMDQVIFAPFINLAIISVLGKLQHKTLDQIKEKLRAEYLDVLKNNWKVSLEILKFILMTPCILLNCY